MKQKQAAHRKRLHQVQPIFLRVACVACIELLSLLCCTIVLMMLSISMYKSFFLKNIEKSDTVLANNLMLNYDAESDQKTGAEWISDQAYAQTILSWTAEATCAEYFLFDADGVCLLCSDPTIDFKAIKLDESLLEDVQQNGEFTSDFFQKKHMKSMGTVMRHGTLLLLSESDGVQTPYYLFSSVRTSVMNVVMIKIWMTGIICFILLSFLTVGITMYCMNRYHHPLQKIVKITEQYAKGNYEERLEPSSFEEPIYESIAYSINELAHTAENAENSRKQFVSNVSHEMRTPMTIISGYVDAMLDGTAPKNKRNQYLSIVSQEMQRLKILISSMLNLTRFDNGTIQIHYQMFPIQDLVFRTILMFESRMEKRQISLEGLDSDPIQVWADPDLMGQVIYNLFENAVKFVNTGGTISFTFSEEQKETLIAIRNTGAGISKEELPKIFERFYKSDDSRSHDKTGLGIGLDITKNIIHLHKAKIYVNSEEGAYTEFLIRLPKKDVNVASSDTTKENS